MATDLPHQLATLIIGFLAGLGTLIYFVGRRDRESGCFYTLLQMMVLMIGLVIFIAVTTS